MARLEPSARAHAVSRPAGLARQLGTDALYVDTADAAPPEMARFRPLNPFCFDPALAIPVPGTSAVSRSVEAIWQGLKLVEGRTELDMFHQTPWKRPPDRERTRAGYDYQASQFRYKDQTLDLVSARYIIYLPSYLYVLEHGAPEPLLDEIERALEEGRPVAFYDWDANFRIDDPSSSFSHSCVLAAWFNGTLEIQFLAEARRRSRAAGGADALEWLDNVTRRYRRRRSMLVAQEAD